MNSTASTKNKSRFLFGRLNGQRGNAIAYIAMVMIIFGAIGVVMTSLFTSSIVSTTTPNHSRRALYLTEAGMRYGLSELRNEEFATSVIDALNNLIYTVSAGETFTLNVFGPWFDSSAFQDITTGDNLLLTVVKGEIPEDYSIPSSPPYVSIVNLDYVTTLTAQGSAEIQGYTPTSPTTLELTLVDNFLANQGERVCLAVPVHATSDGLPITNGGEIFIALQAQYIMPESNGAIEIRHNDYFYQTLEVDEPNNRVRLTNLSGTPDSDFDYNLSTSDYVILSPRNYEIIPTGTSESISAGGTMNEAVSTYDQFTVKPGTRKPDIDADAFTSNLGEIEPSGTNFIGTDVDQDQVNIGGGYTPPSTSAFGAVWYDADKGIGSDQNFCQAGKCEFGLGVRAFFLADFVSQGDGITFSLINGASNNAGSVGGDIELSELLGYAGDSRTQADGSAYLATTVEDRGIDEPKIAVEFDTRTNNATLAYCADASNVNLNARNDPFFSDKDAVQYVFWGKTDSLNIPCRGDDPLYDDNRHDAGGQNGTERWRFGAAGDISRWRPAIGADGTIHISAKDATLYALNPDGSVKWTFNLGDNSESMPGIDPNTGTLYSDIAGNSIVAIDSDGNELWRFGVNSDIDSTPTVGPDGRVYFGTDFEQSLYAIDPTARAAALPFPQLNEWQFSTLGEIDNVPALSSDASVVYFVSKDNNLYAVNTSDGTELWRFPILTEPGELDSSPTVDPTDGTIYVGSDDNRLYAINPNGTEKWNFPTGADIESSPALDPSDRTIYIGSDDSKVWAVNPDGTEKWQFLTGGAVQSSATVDSDGTILIGSLDGNFYALNPDGTQEWNFATGAGVPSSPALGTDGVVHIGSNDNNFYAINQFAEPRNNKDLFLTSNELGADVDVLDTDDWLNGDPSKGPWAVRLEVNRSILADAGGKYDYELSLWIRQCQDLDCGDILGTLYQDTRVDYEYSAVADLPLEQQFELSEDDHLKFDRLLFGFTGATASGQSQSVIIRKFQLSFSRPGDSTITSDPDWP